MKNKNVKLFLVLLLGLIVSRCTDKKVLNQKLLNACKKGNLKQVKELVDSVLKLAFYARTIQRKEEGRTGPGMTAFTALASRN